MLKPPKSAGRPIQRSRSRSTRREPTLQATLRRRAASPTPARSAGADLRLGMAPGSRGGAASGRRRGTQRRSRSSRGSATAARRRATLSLSRASRPPRRPLSHTPTARTLTARHEPRPTTQKTGGSSPTHLSSTRCRTARAPTRHRLRRSTRSSSSSVRFHPSSSPLRPPRPRPWRCSSPSAILSGCAPSVPAMTARWQ